MIEQSLVKICKLLKDHCNMVDLYSHRSAFLSKAVCLGLPTLNHDESKPHGRFETKGLWVAQRLHFNASASEEVLNAPLLPCCCCMIAGKERVFVIPQNFRCHENARPLVGGDSIEQLSICNRLTSSHLEPVHLYPALLEHFLLSWLCFYLSTYFVSPIHHVT